MILASIRRKATLAAAFLAAVLAAGQAFAALDVACVFEVRQTGADTNGGGFAWGAGIAAPTIPTVTASGSGGTVAAATYYVVVTYTDAWGDTVISPEQSVTTSGATASFTITGPIAATGAKTWNAYCGTVSGGPYFPQGTGLTIAANRVVTTTPPTTGTQPRGVDYSQQDSPQINVADGVANGTTTFTSATAGFTGSHVSNLIRTGATTWRRIVGVTNATTVVLDATVSTATSLPVVVGGAFATLGNVMAAVPANGSIAFIKYSVTFYTMSASSNVSGGSAAAFTQMIWVGYNTTRTIYNRDTNRPLIKPAANNVTLFTDNSIGSNQVYSNLAISNPDARTSCTFIGSSGPTQVTNCQVIGLSIFRNSAGGAITVRWCNVSVSTQLVTGANGAIYDTDWHDGAGIQLSANSTLARSNVYNITAAGTYAVQCNGLNCVVDHVNIYHVAPTTGPVAAISLASECMVQNCVIEDVNPVSGSGYIFDYLSSVPQSASATNCFYFNVKTALANPATVTSGMLYGATLLTASPFTAPGSGNFAPNNSAGGGAVIRGASLPTTFPAGTSVNALDAGAVQHAATGGASNIAF